MDDERVETVREPERVERETTMIRTGGGGGGGSSGLVALVVLVVVVILALLLFAGPLKRVFTGGDVNVDIKAPDIELPTAPAKPSGK